MTNPLDRWLWNGALTLLVGLACQVARGDEPRNPVRYPNRYAAAEAEAAAPAVLERPPAGAGEAGRPLPLSPPAEEQQGAPKARPGRPLVTGAASLGIVLGLFLLVVLVTKRGMPQGTATLPQEVVEVLGRAPLVGRQQVHLVRCANKLLLVYAAPGGVQTLTEITEPAEVDRLLELCQGSPRAAGPLRQFLGQLGGRSRERGYIAGHDRELDFAHLESAHAGGRDSRT